MGFGSLVVYSVGLVIERSRVQISLTALPSAAPGQAADASPSGIVWN